MVKACKLRPVENRQGKKWDKQVCKEFSHEINGCRYYKQLHKRVSGGFMEHPQSESKVKGWPSWMENWFMWHDPLRRFCQHHPPVKAAGKIASHCTKLPQCSAGWYNPGRNSRHTALLVSKIPESRGKWGRNLPARFPLLLSCLLEWLEYTHSQNPN